MSKKPMGSESNQPAKVAGAEETPRHPQEGVPAKGRALRTGLRVGHMNYSMS